MKEKILIIAILIFSLTFAQGKGKKKEKVDFGAKADIGIDFEAIGGLGERAVADSRLRRVGVVETELKVLPADSVELEFDLEFDWRFSDVTLKKLFVRYNFDNSNARLGFMKKMFTLEEIKSSKDRPFMQKSMINDVLEDFFLLGHDFSAQYRYNFSAYTLIGGYSADGNNRNFVYLTLVDKSRRKLNFTASVMYQNYREKDGSKDRNHAFYANAGIEFDGRVSDFELECVFGKNPEKYGYVLSWENDGIRYETMENIGFFALRYQETFDVKIRRKHLNAIVPLYEISFFSDSYSVNKWYWQARPGINFCFTPKNRLQWRTNFDLILTARNQERARPQITSQRVVSGIFVNW